METSRNPLSSSDHASPGQTSAHCAYFVVHADMDCAAPDFESRGLIVAGAAQTMRRNFELGHSESRVAPLDPSDTDRCSSAPRPNPAPISGAM